MCPRLLLLVLFTLLAHAVVAAPPVLEGPSMRLAFAADGRPASLQAGGEELLNVRDPGPGFYLSANGPDRVPLSDVSMQGNLLVARTANGTQEVEFEVHQASTHLALRIRSLKGIPASGGITLHLEIHASERVRATELDYMTETHNDGSGIRVDWNYLWHRNPQDPLGGAAIYSRKDDADEDDTLLHIWVEEGLPHPKIVGDWTLARARQWMADWQKMFADRSQLILEGDSLQGLYAALPYARKAQIKEIYLFTNTWRPDAFWPETAVNWAVNTKVFPKGDDDLRAFSEAVRAGGMRLNLHYVSGGIGLQDPVYGGPHPDRRLASWGGGMVAAEVGPADRDIPFHPATGLELPYRQPEGQPELMARPPELQHFFEFNKVRIEDEIVRVGSFENTGSGEWLLKGCDRGQDGSKAAAHPVGADAAGLIVPYGANYVPDNDSPLLDEIAAGYAGLLNRCHISHTEYDGAEIHCCSGRWGYRKYATLVYEKLDHPVTAHDSSGGAPRPYFEYRLNSTQAILRGTNQATDGNYSAAVLLSTPAREAASLLDTHYLLSQGNIGGAMGIAKPEPMFGVSARSLQDFGLTDRITQALLDWKAVARLLTDDQRKRINASFGITPARMPEHSQHPSSAVVWTARQTPGGYAVVPVRVLTRKSGDILWQQGQEHGPLSPRQYVRPGEELLLESPDAAQPLHFILRALWAVDPEAAAAASTPAAAPTKTNILLQPSAAELKDRGDVTVEQDGPALKLTQENARDSERWELKNLPRWDRGVDMTGHRAIGMDVTGDGSGAILLLQIPGRDYVLPIDFKGRRHVEIPNGEVAWSSGLWGWRMDTKSTNYAGVRWLKLGFGFLPARTRAEVKVENLQALAEIPAELQDPVIHARGGTLQVKGSIASGEYLEYEGGSSATVYDENWRMLKELPVSLHNWNLSPGTAPVAITTPGMNAPWLEVQFLTEGEPLLVRGP